jgi:D-cysteine desulfhydrase
MFLPAARIIGISVSRSARAIQKRTAEIIAECSALLGTPVTVEADSLEAHDQYAVEYGIPTESGQQAILSCARTEGLLLDPIYTGKAMAGLIDLIARKVIDPGITTVFLHTGGLPVLFSFERSFSALANCTTLPLSTKEGRR